MLPSYRLLREQLRAIIANKAEQGHETEHLQAELDLLPDSYDTLARFARRLAELPLRRDWTYVEPNALDEIWAACDPARPTGPIAWVAPEQSAERVEAAFLGRVCGCILGKPLEINPDLEIIRQALEAVGEWPLDNYISERVAPHLPSLHPSWPETVRERMAYAAPDDDLNYTLLGMLLLEEHGRGLTTAHVRDAWLRHLPIGMTFGPERRTLLKAGMNTLAGGSPDDYEAWAALLNADDEKCGALIRADAYGYACPGHPALAAELAWRDAQLTHRRTGIYGAMFTAAAIAAALAATGETDADRLGVFETALQFVPRRSRFYQIASDSLAKVAAARDWLDGYERIHGRYQEYAHCRVFQEVGTLMVTLRFARDVGHGICLQVSQGNDTDSFGATAGSLLGAFFGPGRLEDRWLAPFHDELRSGLALFYERSLSALARRMGRLPATMAR